MPKKTTAKTEEVVVEEGVPKTPEVTVATKTPKKKITQAVLHIQATFNNTKVVLTDKGGNSIAWSSSGALGFKGAKKGTPFAAAKVGDILAEKAEALGIKEIEVIIRGVGSGRESAIRSFIARGFDVSNIKDMTPVPFNGPKAKKPRRV
jgi:small subunit ribosomal protein S11